MAADLVVIPVRDRPGPGQQLRCAVRAWWQHSPGCEVVLIGGRPDWWRGAHVPTTQTVGQAYQWSHNFPAAMRAATRLGAARFWWAADDIFPLADVPADPPTWCRPMDLYAYLAEWRTRAVSGSYTRSFIDGMEGQAAILQELGVTTQHNADMHMPHLIRADRLFELLSLFAERWPDHPAGHWRAVYGGLWPGRVERMPDPKVMPGERVDYGGRAWISTSNASWRRGVRRVLERRFPDPSPWGGRSMTTPVKTVILLPYRSESGGWRETILHEVVLPHLRMLSEMTGAVIVQADSGHEPFSVGNSFNKAAELADEGGRWHAALLHEADFITPLSSAAEALRIAADGPLGLVYAWSRHVRLSRTGTQRLIEGKRERFQHGREFRLGSPRSPGGPRALNRILWNDAEGFHPGFVGWGYEDNHFLWKTERLVRSSRLPGDLLNAWHPRRHDDPGNPYFAAQAANFDLWQRLKAEGEAE